MSIRPYQDRVVVERLDSEEKSSGGIFIPDSAKEKPQQGKVLAVGKGKFCDGKLFPLDIKAGDIIIFGKYAGSEIKVEDKDFLIIREDDIMGVVE